MDDQNTPPPPPIGGEPLPSEPTPPAAGTRTASKRTPIIAAVVAIVVLAAVGAGALVFSKLAGTGDVLVGSVPADSLVYATAYLDPAAQQKMNLQGLLEKFPSLSEGDLGNNVDQGFNAILSGSGLNYEKDVKPWIGSQIGVVVTMKGGEPQGVVLIDSTDSEAAAQTLEKVNDTTGSTFSSQEYQGTRVSTGGDGGAYGIVGNVVVLSSDLDSMKSVIDAANGDVPNLGNSDDYQNTLKTLPEERLALAYVNIKAAVGLMGEAAGGTDLTNAGPLATLDAFSGVGASVAAETDGISIEISAPVDVAKLPAPAQAAFNQKPHENTVLAWTPSNAYGTIAFTGLDTQLKTLLDQAKSNPAFSSGDQLLGISDALATLTGDAGIEVTPGSGPIPTGAFLLGTNDTASTQEFLDKVSRLASSELGAASGDTLPAWVTEDYNGVTINELPIPEAASSGVEPSYAVTDGMVIIGASSDAVKASIDAHSSGSSITTSPTFTQALGHVDAENNQLFYADVQAIVGGVKEAFPEEDTFFASGLANLTPIKSVIVTSTSDSNGQSAKMFIVIS